MRALNPPGDRRARGSRPHRARPWLRFRARVRSDGCTNPPGVRHGGVCGGRRAARRAGGRADSSAARREGRGGTEQLDSDGDASVTARTEMCGHGWWERRAVIAGPGCFQVPRRGGRSCSPDSQSAERVSAVSAQRVCTSTGAPAGMRGYVHACLIARITVRACVRAAVQPCMLACVHACVQRKVFALSGLCLVWGVSYGTRDVLEMEPLQAGKGAYEARVPSESNSRSPFTLSPFLAFSGLCRAPTPPSHPLQRLWVALVLLWVSLRRLCCESPSVTVSCAPYLR